MRRAEQQARRVVAIVQVIGAQQHIEPAGEECRQCNQPYGKMESAHGRARSDGSLLSFRVVHSPCETANESGLRRLGFGDERRFVLHWLNGVSTAERSLSPLTRIALLKPIDFAAMVLPPSWFQGERTDIHDDGPGASDPLKRPLAASDARGTPSAE